MSKANAIRLLKWAAGVLIIAVITFAAISGYLIYNNSFNSTKLSEGLFYAAIAYIVLSITPMYEVLSSTNHISYMYGEYAVKGKIDAEDRIADISKKKNYRFSVLMLITSVLLYAASALAGRLF